jgi:hypothetical protein
MGPVLSLRKLFAVTLLSAAAVAGTASAQYSPSLRPGLPAIPNPNLTLPPGVRPVPTLPGAPGWPRPFPNPGPFPPSPGPVIDIDYKVFYRTCPRSPWQYYGRAESGREARRAERYLESAGYQVKLVETFGNGWDRFSSAVPVEHRLSTVVRGPGGEVSR